MFVENYRQENAELTAGGEARPIPYPTISEHDWRVWNLLLPFRSHTMDKIAALNTSSDLLYLRYGVPYEVTTEIRRASEYFDQVEIWRARRIDKDPIAVGVHGNDRYLIARWGLEKLIPFEAMKKTMLLVLAWKYVTNPVGMASLAALGLLTWGFLL